MQKYDLLCKIIMSCGLKTEVVTHSKNTIKDH